MQTNNQPYPLIIRILHTGMAIFGVCAYLTGELAEDAEHGFSAGYWLHAYLGITVFIFLFGHTLQKILSGGWELTKWNPGKGSIYTAIVEDLNQLKSFKLPIRSDHNGLAALVQAFGLFIFMWMSVTGLLLFILGDQTTGLAHDIAELHEFGGFFILVFLILHVGAVIIHTLLGHGILQRMSPFTKTGD